MPSLEGYRYPWVLAGQGELWTVSVEGVFRYWEQQWQQVGFR